MRLARLWFDAVRALRALNLPHDKLDIILREPDNAFECGPDILVGSYQRERALKREVNANHATDSHQLLNVSSYVFAVAHGSPPVANSIRAPRRQAR